MAELNVKCPVCGKAFHLKPYSIKRSKQNFCSKKCFYEAKKTIMRGCGNHQYGIRGERNSSWNGGKRTTCYGYTAIYMPDHPFARDGKIVLEHRLVAEKYLLTEENSVEIDGKRYLKPEYIVHHKKPRQNRQQTGEFRGDAEREALLNSRERTTPKARHQNWKIHKWEGLWIRST